MVPISMMVAMMSVIMAVAMVMMAMGMLPNHHHLLHEASGADPP